MPRIRPILFSGPMIRALLDGRKRQTRPNHFVIATTFVVHQMNIDEFLAQREAA